MGYSTDFNGALAITPAPNATFTQKVNDWLSQRHMVYNREDILQVVPQADQETVDGNPVAASGWNWISNDLYGGNSSKVQPLNSNQPPQECPGLWSDWRIESGKLVWSGSEKSYDMYDWIKFLITYIFEPAHLQLNGTIDFSGEDGDDQGTFTVTGNQISGQCPRY